MIKFNESLINPVCGIFFFFNFSGENVNEFFFRAVALTFDRSVLRELEGSNVPATQIGNKLISK